MFGFDDDSMASYYAEQGSNAMLSGEFDDEEPLPVTCRYCGKNELHWVDTGEGWRLADVTNVVHACKKYVKGRKGR